MIYNFFDIFNIILSVIGFIGVGSVFIEKNIFSSFIAGIVISAAIISPLSYYDVSLVKYVIWLQILLGLFISFIWFIKNKNYINVKKNFHIIVKFLVTFIFFLVLLRSLHYQNYVYDTHDLLYFSWVAELINAEYTGPIRLSVSWPNEMAVNHLLPGSMLASIGIFISQPSMLSIIEIRYLLISASLASYTLYLLNIYRFNFIRTLALFMIFHIFSDAIILEITISSFAYLIILFEILRRIFNSNQNDKELLFFSIMLIIAKAPIFLIASLMACWFIFNKGVKNLSLSSYFAGFLVMINIISWAIVQSPSGTDASFSIALPYDIRSILGLASLPSWALENAVTGFIKFLFNKPFLIMVTIIYIFLKYYYLYFVFRDKNLNINQNKQSNLSYNIKIKGLDIYFLTSLFSFVLIRNGWDIGHQAHSFLLSSVIIVTIIFIYYAKNLSNMNMLILSFIFILHAIYSNPINPLKKYMENKSNNYTTVKFNEIKILNDINYNKFYKPKIKDSVTISQIKASLLGMKIDSKQYPSPLKNNQITRWIIWKN